MSSLVNLFILADRNAKHGIYSGREGVINIGEEHQIENVLYGADSVEQCACILRNVSVVFQCEFLVSVFDLHGRLLHLWNMLGFYWPAVFPYQQHDCVMWFGQLSFHISSMCVMWFGQLSFHINSMCVMWFGSTVHVNSKCVT